MTIQVAAAAAIATSAGWLVISYNKITFYRKWTGKKTINNAMRTKI
jgi:hypothetical protein